MLRGNCFTIGYFHKMLTKLTFKCWLDNDAASGNMLKPLSMSLLKIMKFILGKPFYVVSLITSICFKLLILKDI